MYFFSNSDSDDEEYWFQNADPKRPKINQPPVKNVPKRIFHKLEPQVRPTLEQLSPSNLVNNVRLPRKTILNKESPDLDLDDELSNSSSSPSLMKRNPDTKLDDQGDKEVITLPEPGESSTDEPDNNEPSEKPSEPTATIEEAGQKLGGMANVAFESEETQLPNSPKNETKPQKMYILPAIFYVHGVGGSANIWANQIEYFAQLGHEVIAPDLLGHGFSSAPDKPKSYTFPKILRDILTIFDHFIPRSREVVVVGHSYGCSMAAALARSRPESVKLLVMCASGGPTPLAPPKQLSKVPKSLIGCLKPFLKCRFGTSQKYVSRGKATKIQEAFDVPAYVLHHVLMGQLWPEGEIYNQFSILFFNLNFLSGDASYHRKIQIPTLLVYGMKDPLVSLVEMCEMERTIPKAYLELIPLAGHMLMQDQPTELNIMMKKFITRYFSPSI